MTKQHAYLSLHIAALLFGLTGIFGELIQADAWFITAGRAFFACVVLFFILKHQGHKALTTATGAPSHWRHILVAAFCLAIHWVSFFIAVKTGGIAIATLGFASFPAFITLCEWLLFKEKISRKEWAVLALVTFGLLLVSPPTNFSDQSSIGMWWALLSGLSFALFGIANRRVAAHLSALQLAFRENLIVFLLCVAMTAPSLLTVRWIDWFWVMLLGVFCTALSHYLLIASLRHLNARSAGIVIALEPIYAIFFAMLIFQQYPTYWAIVGGSIMISAIVWSTKSKT